MAKTKKDHIDPSEIEQEYGMSYALFKAFPELNNLLTEAVNQGYTAQQFVVHLKNTKWFQDHQDSWRQMEALKYSDPKTYQDRLLKSQTAVQNLVSSFGAQLTPQAMNRLAERALLFNLNDGQIRDIIANHVIPTAQGHYGGDLSAIEGNLRQTALQNGVRLGDQQFKGWMQAIVRGDASQDQYQTYIRDMAAKSFSAYGDQIKGGMNMSDLSTPYVNSMAQILELNPSQLNMFDPTIRKAMAGVRDPKTNQVTPMSITDFEDSLRQDKRWQYTKNARDTATDWTRSLSEMFGLG